MRKDKNRLFLLLFPLLFSSGCSNKNSSNSSKPEYTITYHYTDFYSDADKKQYGFSQPARVDRKFDQVTTDDSHIYHSERYAGIFDNKVKEWEGYLPVLTMFDSQHNYAFSKELPVIEEDNYSLEYSGDYTTDTYTLTYHQNFPIDIDFSYFQQKEKKNNGSVFIGLRRFDKTKNTFASFESGIGKEYVFSNEVKLFWQYESSKFHLSKRDYVTDAF